MAELRSKALKHVNFIGKARATRILEKIFEIHIWHMKKPRDIHYESVQKELRRLGLRNSTIKFPGGLAFGMSIGMKKRGRWHLDDIKVCKCPPHTRKKRKHYSQVR